MSAAARLDAPGVFDEREQPAYAGSFLLSVLMHALLVGVLLVTVRFQSHAPETVTVELWEPPAPVAAPKPAPEPPKPAPEPPKAAPEPPKPEPKLEKPEIVEKPAPKPKPEVKPKPEAKPKPAPKPAPKARDEEFRKRLQEQLAREQAAEQERQLKDMIARQQAAATSRALATWTDKIRAKIRGNIILPLDLKGNPEAIFDVALLPTGEVLSVRKRKSSGHAGYDDAVERAIYKSSPLPKPDSPSLFRRDLELKFHPLDQ